MTENRVELYKMRDFGAKINATIEYIRFNFGPLIKVVLLVVLPFGLIIGILLSGLFESAFSLSDPNMDEAAGLALLSVLGVNYLVIALISMLVYAFLLGGVYTFMKLRNEGADCSVSAVYSKVLGKIPGMILLMILSSVCIIIGMILLVIPGIYLMIVLTLAIPIYIFEETDIGQAFTKSFRLIREKWWSTFGLLIVTSVIAGVVSYVFAIPFYIFMFGNMFSVAEEAVTDPEAVFSAFTGWGATLGMAIMMVGSYITYLIPVIAIGFQYTNLVERQEGRGLTKEIDEFEKLG